MRLGYLLFSRSVEHYLLGAPPTFAFWFGECLQKHLEQIQGKDRISLPPEVSYRTEHSFGRYVLYFITELDKNLEPRTAVVFPTDGAL